MKSRLYMLQALAGVMLSGAHDPVPSTFTPRGSHKFRPKQKKSPSLESRRKKKNRDQRRARNKNRK